MENQHVSSADIPLFSAEDLERIHSYNELVKLMHELEDMEVSCDPQYDKTLYIWIVDLKKSCDKALGYIDTLPEKFRERLVYIRKSFYQCKSRYTASYS